MNLIKHGKVTVDPGEELKEIMAIENNMERSQRKLKFIAQRFEEIRVKMGRVLLIQTMDADHYYDSLERLKDEFKPLADAWGTRKDKGLQVAANLFSDAKKASEKFRKAVQQGKVKDAEAYRDQIQKYAKELMEHISTLGKICTYLLNEEHKTLESLKKADAVLKDSIENLTRAALK
ncbi:hypothetical protein KY362_00785 [Candidatus Woesearchaeota archaeon]|nr:hypothetical protein [Candidatus Woesearchaeota archaeon]